MLYSNSMRLITSDRMTQKQYNWNRRWVLQGTRDNQETNISVLAQRWLSFGVDAKSSNNGFVLDELSNVPVIILLGEPGIGKSSEIRRYFNQLDKSDPNTIWKFKQFPPNNFNTFFQQPDFDLWKNGENDAVVFIDSFDEAHIQPIQLGRSLVEALESSRHIHKLRLRIACRTADWSEDTTMRLRYLFGEDNVLSVELDSLGQQEIVEAVISHGIDVDKFLEQVEEKALAPLTLKPITLSDLIREFQSRDGVLPDTRTDLYLSMCRRLIEEHNPYHDQTDRRNNFTTETLFIEAARIATIMLTTRRLAVWLPSSTRDITENSIPVDDLHLGSIAEEKVVRAVLHTGLFSSRGANQLGWAHLSYAEFLAAYFMSNHMSVEQIKSLIIHPSGDKVIPQLREVVAWLTSMNSDLLGFVVDLDPETLFQSDLIVEDTFARKILTEILLDLYHREILIEIPFNSKARYRRLNHPDLAEQLVKYVYDDTRHQISRYVAISIIHACELSDAVDNLINLVLDSELDNKLRNHAAYALARHGSAESKQLLKPLLFDSSSSLDDELRGAVLMGLWPEQLTTIELFQALTPRSKTNFVGVYSSFLHSEIIDDIPDAELPVALDWAAYYIHNFTDAHHQIDITVQRLIDEIVYRSWLCFDNEDIPAAFARVVLAKISNFQSLFGYQRRAKLDPPFQMVIEELLENHEKRRKLLLLVVGLIENPSFSYSILKYDIPLLLDADLEWLIKIFQIGSIRTNKMIGLIQATFARWNPSHLELMSEEIETNTALRDVFEKWFFVRIGSPHANDLKEAHRRELEREAKYEIIQANRQEKIISPSPLERLNEILEICEQGDISEWWRTNRWLATNEYGGSTDQFGDIRRLQNWELIDPTTKDRIISLGIKYLMDGSPETEKWLGQHAIWRPALAGYRMLFLLFDEGVEIESGIWEKWIPAIITFPNRFIFSDNQKHKELVTIAYYRQKQKFLNILREYISYWHEINIDIVSNYLFGFSSFLDDDLTHIFLSYLDDPNIKSSHYDSVLNFLLHMNVPAVCERVVFDMQTLYQRYQLLLHRIPMYFALRVRDLSSKVILLKFVKSTVDVTFKTRDKAARLAANLITSPIHDDWWYTIWDLIKSDVDFGRRIIESTADTHDDSRIAIIGSQLKEAEVGDLYLWIAEQYPFEEDPDIYDQPGFSAFTSRHNVSDWRNSLLNQLAEHGTLDALNQLDRIGEIYQDLYQLKRLRKLLLEHLYKETWHPPQPHNVLSLLKDNERRFIQTDEQLLDVIIESLGRLQVKLQGETYSAADLWNIVQTEDICRPKDENHLSNYIKRHLEQDLANRGIIVNREVEIRRKEGGQNAAPGEVPDLYVTAATISEADQSQPQLTVLVEVKGNWHNELRTAAETQLVNRYLKDNDKSASGLYLVGWFNCQQWDKRDSRRGNAMRLNIDTFSEELAEQAMDLSNDLLTVRSYILNAALRDND